MRAREASAAQIKIKRGILTGAREESEDHIHSTAVREAVIPSYEQEKQAKPKSMANEVQYVRESMIIKQSHADIGTIYLMRLPLLLLQNAAVAVGASAVGHPQHRCAPVGGTIPAREASEAQLHSERDTIHGRAKKRKPSPNPYEALVCESVVCVSVVCVCVQKRNI